MAEGYAHATGRPGVAMVTSGPAATNVVTPLCDAYMDSVPLVCITGQVPYAVIGTDAFQECDTVGITRPCTKHNYLVKNIADLPSILHEAFHIAASGRPGPVVIDIPKDIQQHEWVPVFPKDPDDVSIPGLPTPPKAADAELEKILRLIETAKQPVIYIGGGMVITAPQTGDVVKIAPMRNPIGIARP